MLSRKFFENELWKQKRVFSECEAWLYLIAYSKYKTDNKAELFRGFEANVERGQILTSVRYLSTAWGWSVKKVRTFLKDLEKKEQVNVDITNGCSLITLCNYSKYNGEGTPKGTPTDTLKGTLKSLITNGITDGEGTPKGTPTDTLKGTNIKENINNILNNILVSSEDDTTDEPCVDLEKTLVKAIERISELEQNQKKSSKRKTKTINDPSKKKTINNDAKELFIKRYKEITGMDYYWDQVSAGSMTSLLNKIRFSLRNVNKSDDDASTLDALRLFLLNIESDWYKDNFSVQVINSKYNEIVSQIHGKRKQSQRFGVSNSAQIAYRANECKSNADFLKPGESFSKGRPIAEVMAELGINK